MTELGILILSFIALSCSLLSAIRSLKADRDYRATREQFEEDKQRIREQIEDARERML